MHRVSVGVIYFNDSRLPKDPDPNDRLVRVANIYDAKNYIFRGLRKGQGKEVVV